VPVRREHPADIDEGVNSTSIFVELVSKVRTLRRSSHCREGIAIVEPPTPKPRSGCSPRPRFAAQYRERPDGTSCAVGR